MSALEGNPTVAGRDFGDFIVWRRDDVPAYQLAVVVDDAAMRISEVVRGEDLLVSTFRQLLLYRALDLMPPRFFHASLVVDESGKRLAKRHGSLSLRALRERGFGGGRTARSLHEQIVEEPFTTEVIPGDSRGTRCEIFKLTSMGSLDFARDDMFLLRRRRVHCQHCDDSRQQCQ